MSSDSYEFLKSFMGTTFTSPMNCNFCDKLIGHDINYEPQGPTPVCLDCINDENLFKKDN